MRKNFNEVLNFFDTIKDLIDRDGKAIRTNPKYRQLQDLIYWNLMDERSQQFVHDYMSKKHMSLQNVALGYKDLFDAMKFKKAIDIDDTEEFFGGLLEGDEYSKYEEIKEVNPNFSAKQFYELLVERDDRDGRKERAMLAQLFREFSKEGKPEKNIGSSLKFKK